MTPELSAVVDWFFRIVTVVGGWVFMVMMGRLKRLEETDDLLNKSIQQLSVDLPTKYVSKPDFERAVDGLFATLRRIEDKLDKRMP